MLKIHDYRGMIFDFSDWDKVKINMTMYLSKVIADFPEEIIGKAAMPAVDDLFKVRDEGWKLSSTRNRRTPSTTQSTNCYLPRIEHGATFKQRSLF